MMAKFHGSLKACYGTQYEKRCSQKNVSTYKNACYSLMASVVLVAAFEVRIHHKLQGYLGT